MEPLQVLSSVVSSLKSLGIPSMLVGSFASSSYGLARLTQDADFIVKLNRFQIDDFVQVFSPEFYVDRGLIEQALTRETSFNIIHFLSSFKVDFFILRKDPFSEEEFSRKVLKQVYPSAEFTAFVQTPEDALLSKLGWYRQGGGVSENQWRDVIGILKTQAGRLDPAYLQKWALELGI